MPMEWSLDPEIFYQITRVWVVPEVELLATKFNAKVEKFCSIYREDDPLVVHALSIPWRIRLAYIFPPVSMIPKVVMNIRQD